MKTTDQAKEMVKLTGGTLAEIHYLSIHDIELADFGGSIIHIGLGAHRRDVIVHDSDLPQQLWEEALNYSDPYIFRNASRYFDETPQRAIFAKRKYNEYALNGKNDYTDPVTGETYDSLALQLVARTMAISVDEVIRLLQQ